MSDKRAPRALFSLGPSRGHRSHGWNETGLSDHAAKEVAAIAAVRRGKKASPWKACGGVDSGRPGVEGVGPPWPGVHAPGSSAHARGPCPPEAARHLQIPAEESRGSLLLRGAVGVVQVHGEGQAWSVWGPEVGGLGWACSGSCGRSCAVDARLGSGACTLRGGGGGGNLGRQGSWRRGTLPSPALGTGMLDSRFRLFGDTGMEDMGQPVNPASYTVRASAPWDR